MSNIGTDYYDPMDFEIPDDYPTSEEIRKQKVHDILYSNFNISDTVCFVPIVGKDLYEAYSDLENKPYDYDEIIRRRDFLLEVDEKFKHDFHESDPLVKQQALFKLRYNYGDLMDEYKYLFEKHDEEEKRRQFPFAYQNDQVHPFVDQDKEEQQPEHQEEEEQPEHQEEEHITNQEEEEQIANQEEIDEFIEELMTKISECIQNLGIIYQTDDNRTVLMKFFQALLSNEIYNNETIMLNIYFVLSTLFISLFKTNESFVSAFFVYSNTFNKEFSNNITFDFLNEILQNIVSELVKNHLPTFINSFSLLINLVAQMIYIEYPPMQETINSYLQKFSNFSLPANCAGVEITKCGEHVINLIDKIFFIHEGYEPFKISNLDDFIKIAFVNINDDEIFVNRISELMNKIIYYCTDNDCYNENEEAFKNELKEKIILLFLDSIANHLKKNLEFFHGISERIFMLDFPSLVPNFCNLLAKINESPIGLDEKNNLYDLFFETINEGRLFNSLSNESVKIIEESINKNLENVLETLDNTIDDPNKQKLISKLISHILNLPITIKSNDSLEHIVSSLTKINIIDDVLCHNLGSFVNLFSKYPYLFYQDVPDCLFNLIKAADEESQKSINLYIYSYLLDLLNVMINNNNTLSFVSENIPNLLAPLARATEDSDDIPSIILISFMNLLNNIILKGIDVEGGDFHQFVICIITISYNDIINTNNEFLIISYTNLITNLINNGGKNFDENDFNICFILYKNIVDLNNVSFIIPYTNLIITLINKGYITVEDIVGTEILEILYKYLPSPIGGSLIIPYTNLIISIAKKYEVSLSDQLEFLFNQNFEESEETKIHLYESIISLYVNGIRSKTIEMEKIINTIIEKSDNRIFQYLACKLKYS